MEQWKEVKWFEWFYEVSNLWRVRSVDRVAYKNGIHKFWLKWRVLKWWKDGSWYVFYYLCDWSSKTCKKWHTLVLENFVWNKEQWYECNHKNWIKTDNKLENLEWVTKSEQHKHRHHILWHKAPNPWKWVKWTDNPFSMKVGQYDIKLNLVKIRTGMRWASRELNIDQSSIVRVCKWKQQIAWWFIRKYL
jgi:hypothetical protein